MRKTRKPLIMAMCALVVALGANATLAWLTDTTQEVENTFTVGNIDITLTETGAANADQDEALENSFKMVPGSVIDKNPTVTVEAGSEACYLFVQVTESSSLKDYIEYRVISDDREGWKQLKGVAGVYYREVAATSVDTPFSVIEDLQGEDNQVKVKDTVTKSMMDKIEDGTVVQPTLTFKAYAVQKDNIADAADAWAAATGTN